LHLAARIVFGVMTPMLIVGTLFAPHVDVREPFYIAVLFATSMSLPDGFGGPIGAIGAAAEPDAPDIVTGVTGATGADRASQQDEKRDGSAIDLYGNDVSDAVAKYKLDATGSLYELHSPQTELPRLGSPKS